MAKTARKNRADGQPNSTDPWLSVPQAARALGIANATVLQRALLGELETQTVGGRTFISRDSVDRARQTATVGAR